MSDNPGLGSDLSDDGSKSNTGDGFDTIAKEKGSIRYRDIDLFVLRSRVPTGRNILAAKATLLPTKEAERKSKSSAYVLLSDPIDTR